MSILRPRKCLHLNCEFTIMRFSTISFHPCHDYKRLVDLLHSGLWFVVGRNQFHQFEKKSKGYGWILGCVKFCNGTLYVQHMRQLLNSPVMPLCACANSTLVFRIVWWVCFNHIVPDKLGTYCNPFVTKIFSDGWFMEALNLLLNMLPLFM